MGDAQSLTALVALRDAVETLLDRADQLGLARVGIDLDAARQKLEDMVVTAGGPGTCRPTFELPD